MHQKKESNRDQAAPGGTPGGRGITRITGGQSDPIASALRQMYDDAVQEPLPDDLTRLLDQLDAAEKDA